VRDAFTAYYLNMAEIADPRLRAAEQGRWLRELTSEQDNLHAALRWTTARQDSDAALRFVRALGWYWLLRGQPGEPEALAREVLALEPRERSARMAEARVVCALTAAGETWDIDAVRPVLAAAVADLAVCSPDAVPAHPIAAMGEPMLALYDRDPERAFAIFDRYSRSEDPWVRAAAPLLRGTFGIMLGRTEGAESECQAALEVFRALGERWGTAAVLIQLADFAKLRGDYAAAVAALDEAASLGQELGVQSGLRPACRHLARGGPLATRLLRRRQSRRTCGPRIGAYPARPR
jgi:predicted DCC family thiol-disulfide oxidoreductase YuxK